MNQILQNHEAEHRHQKIDGHSIVATKKKRSTFAKRAGKEHTCISTSPASTDSSQPASYTEFASQLEVACGEGDVDSKNIKSSIHPPLNTYDDTQALANLLLHTSIDPASIEQGTIK